MESQRPSSDETKEALSIFVGFIDMSYARFESAVSRTTVTIPTNQIDYISVHVFYFSSDIHICSRADNNI